MHFYLLEIARKGANDKEFKKITQMCRRYVKNLEFAETEDLPVKKTRVRRFGGGKKAKAPEVSIFNVNDTMYHSKIKWKVGRLSLNVNNQLYSVSFGELRLIS